jgi:ATP-binding cassette subfamily C (CFTR/MRP) protein 1
MLFLDDIFSGLDPMTEEIIFRNLFGDRGLLRHTLQTVVLATHAVHILSSADSVILLGDLGGGVVYQGPYASMPMELVSQRDFGDIPESEVPDQAAVAHRIELTDEADFKPVLHQPATVLDASASDVSRQTGDSTIWKYYLQTAGFRHCCFFVFLGAICMGFTPAQSLWLNAWANDTDSGRLSYYIGVYSVFFVGEIALTTLWIWHVLIFPLSASSIKLHDIQLTALMSATMSFFSTTDTGVTTNRFSQDLNLVDSELPLALIDAVEYVYNCLYKMVLIGIATAYITPIFPLLLGAFWMIQRFYLRTSRQIRFLDLETKAPLYTHFIETLAGLATIRAAAWEKGFERQNLVGLQASQRPFFLLATIQRWLSLVLDLIVSVVGIIVAILAVELRYSINPGYLGLALVNIVSNYSLDRQHIHHF